MMTNERVRRDLDAADAIVRASWDNFVATEPTYVLRDLIAIELDKAREAEREACAKIARRVSSDLGESAVGEAIAKAILQRKE